MDCSSYGNHQISMMKMGIGSKQGTDCAVDANAFLGRHHHESFLSSSFDPSNSTTSASTIPSFDSTTYSSGGSKSTAATTSGNKDKDNDMACEADLGGDEGLNEFDPWSSFSLNSPEDAIEAIEQATKEVNDSIVESSFNVSAMSFPVVDLANNSFNNQNSMQSSFNVQFNNQNSTQSFQQQPVSSASQATAAAAVDAIFLHESFPCTSPRHSSPRSPSKTLRKMHGTSCTDSSSGAPSSPTKSPRKSKQVKVVRKVNVKDLISSPEAIQEFAKKVSKDGEEKVVEELLRKLLKEKTNGSSTMTSGGKRIKKLDTTTTPGNDELGGTRHSTRSRKSSSAGTGSKSRSSSVKSTRSCTSTASRKGLSLEEHFQRMGSEDPDPPAGEERKDSVDDGAADGAADPPKTPRSQSKCRRVTRRSSRGGAGAGTAGASGAGSVGEKSGASKGRRKSTTSRRLRRGSKGCSELSIGANGGDRMKCEDRHHEQRHDKSMNDNPAADNNGCSSATFPNNVGKSPRSSSANLHIASDINWDQVDKHLGNNRNNRSSGSSLPSIPIEIFCTDDCDDDNKDTTHHDDDDPDNRDDLFIFEDTEIDEDDEDYGEPVFDETTEHDDDDM